MITLYVLCWLVVAACTHVTPSMVCSGCYDNLPARTLVSTVLRTSKWPPYHPQDTFFPGLPPSNLHLNLATRDQLYLRLRQLSAGEDIFVTPRGAGKERHHMECCVVSYYIGGSQKGKAAGKVAYRIFDTILEAGNEV